MIHLSAPTNAKSEDNWYEVAYEATGIHPLTKKKTSITKKMFGEWARYHTFLTGKGNTIPVVKNHSLDPTDRLGTLSAVKTVGESFWVQIKWLTDTIRDAVKEASFSVAINEDKTEFSGESFDSALIHLGVTDYPVIKGLKRILLASEIIFENEYNELGIIIGSSETSKGNKMNPEFYAELGLAATATEAEVIAAVKKLKKQPEYFSELGLKEGADEATILSTIKALKAEPGKKDALVESLMKRIVADRKVRISKFSDAQKITLEKHISDVTSDAFEDLYNALAEKKSGEFQSGNQFSGDAAPTVSMLEQICENRSKGK